MIAGLEEQGIQLPEDFLRRYSIYPYHYPYSKNNINSSRVVRNIPNPHVVRLPNLGYSFFDVATNPYIREHCSTINYRIICSHMVNCMMIIQAIKNRGFVHGDLSQSNIMLNPNDGSMTIIDFDWFGKFQAYGNVNSGFPYYMYHLPPECIFIFGFSVNRLREESNYMDIWEYVHQHYIQLGIRQALINAFQHCIQSDPSFLFDPYEAAIGLEAFLRMPSRGVGIESNQTLFETKQWQRLRNKLYQSIIPSLDSFGLGVAFCCLFDRLYQGIGIWNDQTIINPFNGTIKHGKGGVGEDPIFRAIRTYVLNTLIPNMMHSNMSTRWDIDKAVSNIVNELDRVGFQAYVGGGMKRHTIKHKSSKKQTLKKIKHTTKKKNVTSFVKKRK